MGDECSEAKIIGQKEDGREVYLVTAKSLLPN
jgi:hypothetical protein